VVAADDLLERVAADRVRRGDVEDLVAGQAVSTASTVASHRSYTSMYEQKLPTVTSWRSRQNRGYSRMQLLWLRERLCDIVAHELGLDPVEVPNRNYIRAEEMPCETPNRCVYDSGDYARCLEETAALVEMTSRPSST
jgi:CO/xanthine dehydrogenase Mo-binding subunit